MSEEFQFEQNRLEAARERLTPWIIETPTIQSKSFTSVWLKAENLQLTGSFKVRAAFNQLLCLEPHETKRGIVTSSSGNFAQAAAFAATRLSLSAKIVMMQSSNSWKVNRTRDLGGDVVFCEDRFTARAEMVQKIADSEGRAQIYPFDHAEAIYGNASLAIELLSQVPSLKNVIVPISGGGLIGGVVVGLFFLKPAVRIWGVQPAGSNATFLSYNQGRRVSIAEAHTIADGLTVTCPGALTFPLIRDFVAGVVTVSEESIREAVRICLLREKLLVEPAGAVPIAALVESKVPMDQTACVLSGGNILPSVLTESIGATEI